MTIRYRIVDEQNLEPYVEQLLTIERTISYPIEGGTDEFTIVHGQQYHPFFTQMGKSRFLLVTDNENLVGIVAGTR